MLSQAIVTLLPTWSGLAERLPKVLDCRWLRGRPRSPSDQTQGKSLNA
jgi:hypothetical protein